MAHSLTQFHIYWDYSIFMLSREASTIQRSYIDFFPVDILDGRSALFIHKTVVRSEVGMCARPKCSLSAFEMIVGIQLFSGQLFYSFQAWRNDRDHVEVLHVIM